MQAIEPHEDQGVPRGVEPFPGIGDPPTDMRYFPRRHIFTRNVLSVQREKGVHLVETASRFSQWLSNTGLELLCWAERQERSMLVS